MIQGHSTNVVYGYAFQCGEKAVLIAWAPEVNNDRWALDLTKYPDSNKIQVFNIAGKPLTSDAVILGESPVYIVSGKNTIEDLINACKLSLL